MQLYEFCAKGSLAYSRAYSTAGGAAWKANWHVSLFLYRPVADHADSYMAIFNNTIVQ